MNEKIAFRLSLVFALVATGLWVVLSMDFPTRATLSQPPSAKVTAQSATPDKPDDFFAPSPAADALPPAETTATAAIMLPPASTTTPWALPDPVWRVGITQDGLYALSYETLITAGVPVTGAAIAGFQLWHQGNEVAIEVDDPNNNGLFDPTDALVFYSEKFHGSTQDEKYTDENVYWLSLELGATGKRMTSRAVPPTGAPAAGICAATVVAEQNLEYFARWNNNPGTSTTWFWKRMIAPRGQVVTYNFPISLSNLHTTPHTATLLIEVAGRSYDVSVNPDHHLSLTLNGTPLGDVFWDGEVGYVALLELPSTLLQAGDNTLSLGVVGTTVNQDVYFDRAEVSYLREPVAAAGALTCKVPETGTHTYAFSGLPAEARLYDVTDPLNPIRLRGHQAFTFQDTVSAGTRYIGGVPTSELLPFNIYLPLVLNNTNGGATQNTLATPAQGNYTSGALQTMTISEYHPDVSLITPTTGADLLIIAPSEFHTALQPLIQRRQAQGLQVTLAAEQDIYPLFNGGIYHPEAIRRFVAHAYATWTPAPKYLLLVGDGHFNFKGYAPATFGEPARIWIPPYLEFADPDQGEVPVDARYADVDGDGLPELMVGRIPANSEAELESYLNKLLAYDTLPTATWMETMLLVADDGASTEEPYFATGLNAIKNDFFPAWAVTDQVYIQDYCPKPPASWTAPCVAATHALTQTWSQGAALLFYAGHGAPGVWANEPLLRGSQLATLQPTTGQPFIIALDCWDGFWMYPHNVNVGVGRDPISIGERAVLGWGDRGAIAVFGPAGLGYMSIEEQLARAMMQEAFEHGERRVGELTQAGRLAIWNLNSGKYLARTYTLLGDPSMQLRLQDVVMQGLH